MVRFTKPKSGRLSARCFQIAHPTKDGHIEDRLACSHTGLMMGSGVRLLFDVPEPRRIASLPVASIVETIADGGANNNNNASAYIFIIR